MTETELTPQGRLVAAVIGQATKDARAKVLRGQGGSTSAPSREEQIDARRFLAGDDGRLDWWASIAGADAARLLRVLERAEGARRPHARTPGPQAADAA